MKEVFSQDYRLEWNQIHFYNKDGNGMKKILLTGCTLLLLSACGSNEQTNDSGTTNDAPTGSTKVETHTNTTNTGNSSKQTKQLSTDDIRNPEVSLTDAVTIFQQAHPEASIHSVDLDSNSGKVKYEISGQDATNEYEMEIDATTKEVMKDKSERENDQEGSLDFNKILSPVEAIELASNVEQANGYSLTGWSLEADDGIQKYNIEFKNGNSEIDVDLNAVDGSVIHVDTDH